MALKSKNMKGLLSELKRTKRAYDEAIPRMTGDDFYFVNGQRHGLQDAIDKVEEFIIEGSEWHADC